jgi:two-component system, OmpR family, response regulator
MQNQDSYGLTARGEKELRGSVTSLSPAQIELLVRIDGVLTFAQIKAGVPVTSLQAFNSTFQGLLDRGLLAIVEEDPFAEQFKTHLNKRAVSAAEAEADSGAISLKRSGYYVGIARKRGPARVLAPGEVLSAVVVEDEPMLAKFIQSYLSFEGLHVRLAANRAEVIAEFRKLPVPDLVLLDVMLPDADGFDILLRLRQHPALKNVPVIMLTGKSTRESVIKGLASGADGYITKPFEADALMRAVRTVMGLQDEAPELTLQDPWVNKD